VTFTGTSGCEKFVANPFRADKCRECLASLIAHHHCAVATEKEVLSAVEWLSKIWNLTASNTNLVTSFNN